MIALLALAVLAPLEMILPTGAQCPDAVTSGGAVHITYEQGQSAWYTRYGSGSPVRINSTAGTVHAAGERGPKIAVARDNVYAAWQGDYRQGAKVWFGRSVDGGQSFQPQRDLLDGKTPGIDHVEIAAAADLVAVFWLDGRTGEDPDAPITSTIWYSLSRDGGRTFSANQRVFSKDKVRACACCSFSVQLSPDQTASLTFRSGIKNVRDVYRLNGNVGTNSWLLTRISSSNWVLAACPMDGPRGAGATAYTIDGKAYVKPDSGDAVLLGQGKFANVATNGTDLFATWQDGETLSWRWIKEGTAGQLKTNPARSALILTPDGRPLIIH